MVRTAMFCGEDDRVSLKRGRKRALCAVVRMACDTAFSIFQFFLFSMFYFAQRKAVKTKITATKRLGADGHLP